MKTTYYICATPYHIIAASTLACGNFKDSQAKLLVMPHFVLSEEMIETLRQSGIYSSVEVYNYSNKSKLQNLKRLFNAFIPDRKIFKIAHDKNTERVVFFALDFIDAAYLVKKGCEVVFGDDGIGAYINGNCYKPRPRPVKVLKMKHQLELLEKITKLYVYKPDYVLSNRHLDLVEIQQSPDITTRITELVSKLWPVEDVEISNSILYFEQPREDNSASLIKELKYVDKAKEVSGKDIYVKMHPRSTYRARYQQKYQVLDTNAPFEAMILQDKTKFDLMMTFTSTAIFVPFLINNSYSHYTKAILMQTIVDGARGISFEQLVDKIKENNPECEIYFPKDEEEFNEILKNV